MLSDPKQIQEWLNNIAIVEDETWIDLLLEIGPRLAPIHLGKMSYLQLPVALLCYGPTFPFVNEAEKM